MCEVNIIIWRTCEKITCSNCLFKSWTLVF